MDAPLLMEFLSLGCTQGGEATLAHPSVLQLSRIYAEAINGKVNIQASLLGRPVSTHSNVRACMLLCAYVGSFCRHHGFCVRNGKDDL